jgi:hypothetical protein
VCEHVAEELHGVIVAESSAGAADDYTDERYWVQLSDVANTGALDEAVTLADATGVMDRVVTVTNYAEVADGTHNLPAGTPVIIRTARGGTKPWITRYAMHVGGGAISPDGTKVYQRYVYDVAWNSSTCEFTVTYHWLEFERVIDDTEDYHLFVRDWSTDPT